MLIFQSDLRFDLVTAVVSNLYPDLVKFVDRTFDRYLFKPLEKTMELLISISKSSGKR